MLTREAPATPDVGAPPPDEFRGSAKAKPNCFDDRLNALMREAQAGNDKAYERLMCEVGLWLSCYFQRRLAPAVATDAVQEALLVVHSLKHSYQPNARMTPWLTTIARFKWLDAIRASARAPVSLEGVDVSVADHGNATRAAILLDTLLAHLKPSEAEVIRLVKLRGASVEEASLASGQSPALVRVNIHRGLRRIGRLLADGDGV